MQTNHRFKLRNEFVLYDMEADDNIVFYEENGKTNIKGFRDDDGDFYFDYELSKEEVKGLKTWLSDK